MVDIDIRQMKYNYTKSPHRTISYIVIHTTGNYANGADAEANFKYFDTGYRGASADFLVDDKKVIQVNDYKMQYSWHCGDGAGRFGISNMNSVGIELCVNNGGNFEQTMFNAIDLVVKLCKELNLGADAVVRHYDASRKVCPYDMSQEDWKRWRIFKQAVTDRLRPIEPVETVKPVPPSIDLKPIIEAFKTDSLDYLVQQDIVSQKELWMGKLNEPAPVWLVFVIASRILRKLLK